MYSKNKDDVQVKRYKHVYDITIKVDLRKFRELCKRNKWYDSCLSQSYEKALEMAESCHSFGDVMLLAHHVVDYSYEKNASYPAGLILSECCRYDVFALDPLPDHIQRRLKIRSFISRFKIGKKHECK